MFKHLLVPTDGSDLSRHTVARAISFARETGARITFFFAQQDYPVPMYGEGALMIPVAPEHYFEATRQESERILREARESSESAGVATDTDTAVSDLPYQAIIAAATKHECDLIFMASHGRKGVVGFLLGSETQKVLTHSDIPVLVFR